MDERVAALVASSGFGAKLGEMIDVAHSGPCRLGPNWSAIPFFPRFTAVQ